MILIKLPQDLDTAYTVALVREDVGDGTTLLNSQHQQRRQYHFPSA
jgi:hypothetical protein